MNKRPASTEIADRREAHINFLDFAVGSCFCKINCVKSRETIAECMQLLFVSQLSVLLTNEDSFIQKISASLFICNKNVCLMCVLFANVLRML